MTASDGTNVVSSGTVSVDVVGTSSAYAQRIESDGPLFHLRYDEDSGTFISDSSGNDEDFRLNGAAQYQVAGALPADPSTALSVPGDDTYLVSEHRHDAPAQFSLETWFKTTATGGGKLIGFADSQQKPSVRFDKHLYMTSGGQLVFGTEGTPGTKQVITSPGSYRNGAWHYVVATQDDSGMTLYVDGTRVARNSVTTNRAGSGYWRIGGDCLMGWPNDTGSVDVHQNCIPRNWSGTLDETAVYERALSQTEVAEHYALGGGAFAGGPTDFYGKTIFDQEPLSYWRLNEASGTTAADATGASSNGVYAGSPTYAQAGAVAGATGTANRSVKLNGSTGLIRSASASAARSTFSTEVWVRTASTTGGQIVGFGSAATGDSPTQDRKTWFRADGKISFGVRQGTGYYVITSTDSYNDDKFHHVVSTRSPSRMELWVDGVLVASLDQVANQAYTGYWRLGGDSFTGWSGPPTSKYLNGYFDEVAIYPNALSGDTIQDHYSAGNPLAPDTAPPTIPAGLSAGLTAANATLTWRASTDNRAVVGYEVHRSSQRDFTPRPTRCSARRRRRATSTPA